MMMYGVVMLMMLLVVGLPALSSSIGIAGREVGSGQKSYPGYVFLSESIINNSPEY